MAKIDAAYQQSMNSYVSAKIARYDTHKKSQLRDVYNKIVKLNKESPLYKIAQTGDIQKFAINLKESTREIQNIVASLSADSGESIEDVFQKKVATTSDDGVVTAQYIGDDSESSDSDDFTIEVKQLASPQVNVGNYMNPGKSDFAPGTYAFDLNTTSSAYEFQFNVASGDTNRDVQDKLARLIGNAGIGLRAEVITNKNGGSALRIESLQTGTNSNENFLFQIMPQADSASMHAINLLGIDKVTYEPQNSVFSLNGSECSSFSNTFTINEAFRLTLTGTSADNEPVQVGFKPNAEAVADNIQTLIDAYNHLLTLGEEQSTQQHRSKLLSEMGRLSLSQKSSLESIGLMVSDTGSIEIDRDTLAEVVSSDHASDCFETLNNFKEALGTKAANASLDPMNYVNKVLIVYKNPGKNFAAPYITSIYSGMMLDRYC